MGPRDFALQNGHPPLGKWEWGEGTRVTTMDDHRVAHAAQHRHGAAMMQPRSELGGAAFAPTHAGFLVVSNADGGAATPATAHATRAVGRAYCGAAPSAADPRTWSDVKPHSLAPIPDDGRGHAGGPSSSRRPTGGHGKRLELAEYSGL